MDDWEDAVLSSRHIHNRVGGRAGKSKAGDKAHGVERESLEEQQQGRFETFEKNSFRSPKFWLRFHGHEPQTDDGAAERSGTGYLVFSGNDCRKFEGTISCDAINWDNKKLSGWKTIARSERDTPVLWYEQEAS
ncbi:uncharacterized protein PG986_001125 [Apiospora aurea]|uniref:Uncharacterized protein n=1 Tax=Apiospora aurea TaxID=335848 RepID=A0ABR1QW25_9PEZI